MVKEFDYNNRQVNRINYIQFHKFLRSLVCLHSLQLHWKMTSNIDEKKLFKNLKTTQKYKLSEYQDKLRKRIK